MKPTTNLRLARCLATILAVAGPTVTPAAETGVLTQDLVNIRASDLVTTALWSRLPDSYTLQVVLDRERYDAKRRAIAAEKAAANPAPAPPPDRAGATAGVTRDSYSGFFIGNTIANLRGLDPVFGCRTLTLVDGRRVVATTQGAPPAPPKPPAPPAARPPEMVNQPYPPRIKESRIEVWLLNPDGSQIPPVAYSCDSDARTSPGIWVEYKFPLADGAKAVAAAVRIDDAFYIEKLQPLEPKPAAQ